MKHPFQILITNKKGTHIFAIVKNYLQVFDISKGGGDDDIKVGEWQDTTESNHPKIQIENVLVDKFQLNKFIIILDI